MIEESPLRHLPPMRHGEHRPNSCCICCHYIDLYETLPTRTKDADWPPKKMRHDRGVFRTIKAKLFSCQQAGERW